MLVQLVVDPGKGLDVGLDLPSFLEDLCLAETGEDFVKAVAGVIREIRVVLVTWLSSRSVLRNMITHTHTIHLYIYISIHIWRTEIPASFCHCELDRFLCLHLVRLVVLVDLLLGQLFFHFLLLP